MQTTATAMPTDRTRACEHPECSARTRPLPRQISWADVALLPANEMEIVLGGFCLSHAQPVI